MTGVATTGRRWEERLLAALTYPANLALAGIAGFVLALGVVTALPAAIAATRALASWWREGESAVFTRTFKEFAAIWRRTLGWGVALAAVLLVMALNTWFLGTRVGTRAEGVGLLLLGMTVFLAALIWVGVLLVAEASSRFGQGTMRTWAAEAARTAATRWVQTLFLWVLTLGILATVLVIPTVLPVVLFSVPAYLAVRTVGP